MLNAQNALYKALTKPICGDPYNNGIPDNTIVIGHLYHDIGAYKIRAFDFGSGDYGSYEIDPDTVGIFTGLHLDNKHDESMVFVNDEIIDMRTHTKGIVIYDETNYRFAVKIDDIYINPIIPFTEWDWQNTCVTGYKPPVPEKICLEEVNIPDEQLNMITPIGVFRAQAYNNDNEYVGINVEFIPNNNDKPKAAMSLEIVAKTEKIRALIYDKDNDNEDYVSEYTF